MSITASDIYLDLRGLTFHLRDWGGSKRPILLLHGLASNSHFWNLAAPHLARHFHVYALDQRGHGLSSKPDNGYDFHTFSEDIESIIQTMGLHKPIVVGHSWGGNVGIQIAADYPDLLSGLVCIDGGTIEPSAAPGATWEKTEYSLAPPDFAAMHLNWDAFLDRAQSGNARVYWGNSHEEFLRANFEIQSDGTILPRLRREKHMKIVRALWEQEVSQLFNKVICPVLLMPARQNDTNDSNPRSREKEIQIDRAVALLPHCSLFWMEDSIHDVPVQRPRDVADVIIKTTNTGFFSG